MRGIIKIRRHGFVSERSDNILSEFRPIWSRGCQLGTQNARTTRLFSTFEKQRKNKIWWHPSVKRLSHQGRNHRGINFLYNNRTVTVNMEQVQISHDGAVNYSPVNKPLFHVWSKNSLNMKLAIQILRILRLVSIAKESQMLLPAVYISVQDLNSTTHAPRLVRK